MKIDHVIWFSADLAFGMDHFRALTGVKPVFSGPHPGGRTRNSFFATSDSSFVDILAMDPAQPDDGTNGNEGARLEGHGLYHWAMGSTDLEAFVAQARAHGIETSGVLSGGRTRPSGEWLGWKVVGIRGHDFGALVPFFIEWTNSTHPAIESRVAGKMLAFGVTSPRAQEVSELFAKLGIEVPVSSGLTDAIEATFQGLNETYLLRSFEPLPTGFAI